MFRILSNQQKVNLPSVRNSTAKYLYKNLGGGYSFIKTATGAEVKSAILYQFPYELRERYGIEDEKYKEVHEMDVTIELDTYADKLRVNVIEITPAEKTLGNKAFPESTFSNNVQHGIRAVYDWVCHVIAKEFEDYDVLF